MSPEERQLLSGLFDRIRGVANTPRDREAEGFIDDAVRAQPYAPYLLAQSVIVQEQALRAANDRLQQLEAQVQELQQHGQSSPPGSGGFLSGLGSLFGGGSPPPQPPRSSVPQGGAWQQQPPPQPQQGYGQPYPPQQPQGGPWGGAQAAAPQGGGFLKGAMGAAAGVAGGVLLADSIRGLFGGHNNPYGMASGFGGMGANAAGLGGGLGGGTVNNYYGTDPAGQQAQDTLQDMDQDQDDADDAQDSADDAQDAADDYSDDSSDN